MLQETQDYATVINICYGRQTASLQARVPSGLTWADLGCGKGGHKDFASCRVTMHFKPIWWALAFE